MRDDFREGGRFTTYVPLHGHSTYSFGDGVTKIDDIVGRVNEIGAPAAALTEHGNMCSFFKFYKAAREANINPILGCELYVNDLYHEDVAAFLEAKALQRASRKKAKEEDDTAEDEYGSEADNNHFLVYCKNYEGLKNVIALSNSAFRNFYRKPLVSTENIFEKLDSNNIITTGCVQSKFNQLIWSGDYQGAEQLIMKFKEKWDDDFYLEIQFNGLDIQNKVNEFYVDMHRKHGFKPVFSLDYHYARKDDWYLQYILYVVKQRHTIKNYPEKDWFYTVRDLYIKDINDVYQYAEKEGFPIDVLETAIDSTFEINDKVNIDIPIYPDNFPKIVDTESEAKKIFVTTLMEKFKQKVNNGLIPNDKVDEYLDRIKYEVSVIGELGYFNYFLILSDILENFVYKTGGATGAGRGSAAGSLALFVLDVTKIDPIKYNLIFERFLNVARKDPADVDLDIDSETQKEVENYLKDKYGDDKVCHIANFGKFGAKTVVKDLCRIFELDFVLSNKLTSYFDTIKSDAPVDEQIEKARTIAQSQGDSKLVQFIDEHSQLLVTIGNKMIGMVRQPGRHASGILISNKSLNDSELPVIKVGDDIVTGVQEGGDEREVGELGFCKLDILGLKTASIIKRVIDKVEDKYNIQNLENELLKSDMDDMNVYEQFRKGNCRDIFQFGSDNMINLIKKVEPENIVDLTAINSLFRPAVIYAGGIDEYLANKENVLAAKAKLDDVHPSLWPILEESYGVPVFQEQVMFITQEIGGFSLEEADAARKTLKLLHKGNQDKNEDFLQMLDSFKNGAKQRGVSDSNLDWLLDILAKYSEYSFNKSHSLAYAQNAYIAMWLKVNYPLEYYSVLFNYSTSEDLSWFIKQAVSEGMIFNEFKMSKTTDSFDIDYKSGNLTYGLNMVKGLSSNNISDINSLSSENIYELAEDVRKLNIGKRSIEPLCKLQYFSEIHENSAELLHVLNGIKKKKKKQTIVERVDELIEEFNFDPDFTKNDVISFEKHYLDFYISEHPFITMCKLLDEKFPSARPDMYSPKTAENLEDGKHFVYGVISDIQIKKSKKTGKEYYKIVLEDDERQMFVTIFSSGDMRGLDKGTCLIIPCSKNDFGFSKVWAQKIVKIG